MILVGAIIITQNLTKVNRNSKGGKFFVMPAQWTGEIIGEMHLNNVTAKQLAAFVGWNPKYLSAVLNGHSTPKNAEAKLRKALSDLLASQTT